MAWYEMVDRSHQHSFSNGNIRINLVALVPFFLNISNKIRFPLNGVSLATNFDFNLSSVSQVVDNFWFNIAGFLVVRRICILIFFLYGLIAVVVVVVVRRTFKKRAATMSATLNWMCSTYKSQRNNAFVECISFKSVVKYWYVNLWALQWQMLTITNMQLTHAHTMLC